MKLARSTFVIATLALTLMSVVPAGAAGPTWQAAENVSLPSGTSSIYQGWLPFLSCPTANNCSGAGSVNDSSNAVQGLLLSETKGVWQSSVLGLPSNAAKSPGVMIYALGCASEGDCVTGGQYADTSSNIDAFVATQSNGTWAKATTVNLPTGAAATAQNAQVHGASCSSAGNCVVLGTYVEAGSSVQKTQGFVASQVAGTWRQATKIALPTTTNANPYVSVAQISCWSTGNCSAIGNYIDVNNVSQGFLLNEVNGTWQTAQNVATPSNTSAFANISLNALTCASAQNCTAIGTYATRTGAKTPFVVSEVNGVWKRATALVLPSDAASNPRVLLYGFSGITCPTANDCVTGGQYYTASGQYQGFLVNQVNGSWKAAKTLALPSGAQQAGKNGGVVAFTCSSVGNCAAASAYLDSSGSYQAGIANQVNGTWQAVSKITLPNGATTVSPAGGVYGVICRGTSCTALGSYQTSSGAYQGFTVTN